jgi:hypothetical protein
VLWPGLHFLLNLQSAWQSVGLSAERLLHLYWEMLLQLAVRAEISSALRRPVKKLSFVFLERQEPFRRPILPVLEWLYLCLYHFFSLCGLWTSRQLNLANI